jgi:hypothetical protein
VYVVGPLRYSYSSALPAVHRRRPRLPAQSSVDSAALVRHSWEPRARYRFPQALVPDENTGSFALGPILAPGGAGVPYAVVLRGTVASGRLDLELRFLTRVGEGGGTRFTLAQDQSPDYSNLACAA